MKDLSTKVLFITLFLSTAVPFVMQANFQSAAKVASNKKDPSRQRTLMEVVDEYKENLEEVESLLRRGDDVDMRNRWGDTVLMKASERGHLKTVEALIANNADVNIVGSLLGETALIKASRRGHLKVVEELIANNADVNIGTSILGETALMEASERGHFKIVRSLLRNNAVVHKKDWRGWTAFMRASIVLAKTSAKKDRFAETVRLLKPIKKESCEKIRKVVEVAKQKK